MRWRTVVAAVAVTGFLLTACSDDSDDNGSDDESGVETDSVDGESDDASGDSETENGDDGGGENAASGSGGQFCQDFVSYVKEYNEVLTTAFEGSGPPEDISTDTFESLGDTVRSSAPAEIVDDVEIATGQMDLMVAGMTGDTGANEDLMSGDVEAFQTATGRLQDYAQTTCGFDPEGYFEGGPVPVE